MNIALLYWFDVNRIDLADAGPVSEISKPKSWQSTSTNLPRREMNI